MCVPRATCPAVRRCGIAPAWRWSALSSGVEQLLPDATTAAPCRCGHRSHLCRRGCNAALPLARGDARRCSWRAWGRHAAHASAAAPARLAAAGGRNTRGAGGRRGRSAGAAPPPARPAATRLGGPRRAGGGNSRHSNAALPAGLIANRCHGAWRAGGDGTGAAAAPSCLAASSHHDARRVARRSRNAVAATTPSGSPAGLAAAGRPGTRRARGDLIRQGSGAATAPPGRGRSDGCAGGVSCRCSCFGPPWGASPVPDVLPRRRRTQAVAAALVGKCTSAFLALAGCW